MSLAEANATVEQKSQVSNATTGSKNGHEWVDLGLPSGTKWATCNVGASSPSEYGDYFAWGETSPKSSYTWENLKYRISGNRYDNVKFSKYVTDSKNGKVDGKKELELSDDAAYVNWGKGWRMPSLSQIMELIDLCVWERIKTNGRNGFNVVGPNGNSFFLPVTGFREGTEIDANYNGYYWTRSLFLYDSDNNAAFCTDFRSDALLLYYGMSRPTGASVRPVVAP